MVLGALYSVASFEDGSQGQRTAIWYSFADKRVLFERVARVNYRHLIVLFRRR